MNKKIKLSLILIVICLNFFLFSLPNLLFTDTLSQAVTYEDVLEVPSTAMPIEELVVNAGKVDLYDQNMAGNIEMIDTFQDELTKFFDRLSLSDENLVLLNLSTEIVSGTVYWSQKFSTDNGYGEALIEDQSNKIVQFHYYPTQVLSSIDPDAVLSAFFDYLDLPIETVDYKAYWIEIFFAEHNQINAVIDEHRIILNYPDRTM